MIASGPNLIQPTGQFVLISGATTGIGQCCALRLAKLGFQIFAGYRKPEDADSLKSLHANIQPVHLEMTDERSIRQAEAFISNHLQGQPLQGIVNNAGIVISGPVETLPAALWRHQLEVNFIGHISVIQAFLPMLRQSRGRIINMGSVSGIQALPFLGPYSASKFALAALSDSLRLELKPWGIHVALIEPGSIATPIWDKSRSVAEEIQADCSPEGQTLYGSMLESLKRASSRSASRAISPDKVADAVIHGLTSPKPKTRYPIGQTAQLRRFFSWLPDSLKDYLITSKIGGNGR